MTTSPYYEAYWSPGGSGYHPRLNRSAVEVYERHFGDRGADCLDVGCGDGQAIGAYLNANARSYIGVDVSKVAVSLGQDAGLDARVINDASDLPFDDESFDFIACLEVFEHLFATEETAAELRRVLRPGGIVLVHVPNVAHWRHRLDLGVKGRFVALGDLETLTRPWRDPHIRFFTFAAMRGLLEHGGLSVISERGLGRNQARYIPFVGRRIRSTNAGPLSRKAIAVRPSLFGERIQMVAQR